MRPMSELKTPMERTLGLNELAWSPNPTWWMLFGLYFQAWSQLFSLSNGACVLVCVLCIHGLFRLDVLALWVCLTSSCVRHYEYCLINLHKLSDVVNLVFISWYSLCHVVLEVGVGVWCVSLFMKEGVVVWKSKELISHVSVFDLVYGGRLLVVSV